MAISLLLSDDISLCNKKATHILQTTYWRDFLRSLGRKCELFIEKEQGTMIASYLVSFNSIPHTKKTIAYIQKSTLPSLSLIKYIQKQYPDVIYIKIEPQEENTSQMRYKLNSLGFHRSKWNIFLPDTIYIDLTKPIDEIYKGFHQNMKRNIKKAQKAGVVIEQTTNKAAITEFWKLHERTTARQRYFSHNKSYYEHMWDLLSSQGIASMLYAKRNEEIYAAIIIFQHNKIAYYPYGASLENTFGAMALLQYSAIKLVKEAGCISYDLWGTLSGHELFLSHHPLYGVYRFKEGFGGKHMKFVGSYDYIFNLPMYVTFISIAILRKLYYTSIKYFHI